MPCAGHRLELGELMRSKVFGIGLGKTGTTSLGRALQVLGYDHLPFDARFVQMYGDGEIEELLEIAAGKESCEDFPWPLMYPDLYARFPDARFVLMTRSSVDVWWNSLLQHAERTGRSEAKRIAYGYDWPDDAPDHHRSLYLRHVEDIQNFFADKPGQLLQVCWEQGDGWPALCGFLDLPIPDLPFPHANRRPEPGDVPKPKKKSKGKPKSKPKPRGLLARIRRAVGSRLPWRRPRA
jgi:hypothetical protein